MCYKPSNQFGFKKGSSRELVYHLMCNILLDCDRIGEAIVIACLEVTQAFNSYQDSQLLLSANNQSLDKLVIITFHNFYWKLVVKFKKNLPSGIIIASTIILVKKKKRSVKELSLRHLSTIMV